MKKLKTLLAVGALSVCAFVFSACGPAVPAWQQASNVDTGSTKYESKTYAQIAPNLTGDNEPVISEGVYQIYMNMENYMGFGDMEMIAIVNTNEEADLVMAANLKMYSENPENKDEYLDVNMNMFFDKTNAYIDASIAGCMEKETIDEDVKIKLPVEDLKNLNEETFYDGISMIQQLDYYLSTGFILNNISNYVAEDDSVFTIKVATEEDLSTKYLITLNENEEVDTGDGFMPTKMTSLTNYIKIDKDGNFVEMFLEEIDEMEMGGDDSIEMKSTASITKYTKELPSIGDGYQTYAEWIASQSNN